MVIDFNEQRKARLEDDLDNLVHQLKNHIEGKITIDLKEATKAMIEYDRAIAELERDELVKEEAVL